MKDWEPLGMNQLLMRGCVLKNVKHIFGLVVYTGHDTKIMLNSKPAPSKVSSVLKKMNKILYSVFIFQILICVFFAALNLNWQEENNHKHTYLDQSAQIKAEDFFIHILTY